VRLLLDDRQRQVILLTGIEVTVVAPAERCPVCQRMLHVQKTIQRQGITLAHGRFHAIETVRVCPSGCRQGGTRVKQRSSSLAELLPPGNILGYDVMVRVGLDRFLRHRQRGEIIEALKGELGFPPSPAEISRLARSFLVYLESLHRSCAPALRTALEADGGWPLHVDTTGESGRGMLLVAYAGWRRWVLGSWKIPTERADAILPRLQDAVSLFGSPCAVMRDLGRAVTEAARDLVKGLDKPISILACHYHFLADIGEDLLSQSHDKLRELFSQSGIRADLRAFARDQGRNLGKDIEKAREGILLWQKQEGQICIPSGKEGIAIVRSLAQWILDYPSDGSDEGFPFDLPYLDLYNRCLQIHRATETFLRRPPEDGKVKKALERLQRILLPTCYDIPPFGATATTLERRAKLFNELRKALRLAPKSNGRLPVPPAHKDPAKALEEIVDIRNAVAKLTASLRKRRPERGPGKDFRRAIDLILTHLDVHGPFLWGHGVTVQNQSGASLLLVDRTNDILESFFHGIKHGERRRSGRKNLAQDFEQLPPAAALAQNLNRPDYVEIVCGSLESLPQAFAKLDRGNRSRSIAASSSYSAELSDIESASMSSTDRRLVRTEEMDERVMEAALCGFRR
jgi:hypothetical protein